MIDLDNDVRSAAEKAAAIEAEIVNSFIASIREIADDLLSTADLLADADVWVSLSTVANTYSWICPKITDDCAFDVIGGRHPVIESVLRTRGDNFVKNDCNLNALDSATSVFFFFPLVSLHITLSVFSSGTFPGPAHRACLRAVM